MPGTFGIEGPTRTFEAGTDGVTKDQIVHYTAGTVVTAGASQVGVGVALRTAAEGDAVPVRLWSAPGTFQLIASAAITDGDALDMAADGKVATAAAGTALGMTALSAAAADGDVIEATKLGP